MCARAATLQQLFGSLDCIRGMGCDYRILFLDTDTATLIRRFKETRRRHPLMDKGVGMTAAIEKERTMLSALRNRADFVVDTTGLSAAGLRERLLSSVRRPKTRRKPFEVIVQSFGFKYGIPPESGPGVRCAFPAQSVLRDEPARAQRHRPRACVDYVFQGGTADVLMRHLTTLMDFLLPRYMAEGKANLIISVGCTGGKHRSVAIAEALTEHLRGRELTALSPCIEIYQRLRLQSAERRQEWS